jgi:hypothetical protein
MIISYSSAMHPVGEWGVGLKEKGKEKEKSYIVNVGLLNILF